MLSTSEVIIPESLGSISDPTIWAVSGHCGLVGQVGQVSRVCGQSSQSSQARRRVVAFSPCELAVAELVSQWV